MEKNTGKEVEAYRAIRGLLYTSLAALFALSVVLFPAPSARVLADPAYGIMIPLYTVPGATWDTVEAVALAHPGVMISVIVNSNSGPGLAYDAAWDAGINDLVAAGVTVYGYVWCGEINEFDGDRDCTNDVNNWHAWYSGVTAIFVDGFQGGFSSTGEAQVTRARVHYSTVVGNPGTAVAPALLVNVDAACVYEASGTPSVGTMSTLATTYTAARNIFLSYNVGALDTSWVDAAVTYAKWIYVTHDTLGNPWDSVATYLDDEVAAVADTMPPEPPTNVAATDGTSTSNVTVTWTASANATGYRVYRNSVDISGLLGAVTTYTDTTAAAGIVTPGAASATDGTNTANVTLTLAGASVANGTTYTYKVRAVNAGGTSGDSGTDTGYRGVGALTYQWWRSAADSNTNYSSLAGATSATWVDQTAPAPVLSGGTASATDASMTANVTLTVTGTTASGAGRYYACGVAATGATTAYSTPDRGYRQLAGLTYQWYASATDADTGYSIIVGATSATQQYDAMSHPSITPKTVTASDNTSTSYVTLTLTGASANPGTGKYFFCEVSTGGSSANSTHDRGYLGVGALTVQWQRSAADSDADYSNIAGGTTNPYNDTGAPADGSGRYYKAVLTASNANQQTTGANRGCRNTSTPVTPPASSGALDGLLGLGMLAGGAALFWENLTSKAQKAEQQQHRRRRRVPRGVSARG